MTKLNNSTGFVGANKCMGLSQVTEMEESFCLSYSHGIYVGQVEAKPAGVFSTHRQMHGSGTFSFSNGDKQLNGRVYIGEYAHGIRNGAGKLLVNDVVVFEGKWLNGRRHGYGVTFSPDGIIVHEGEWENGIRAKQALN